MTNFKFFLLLIYLLNLISIILCQFENESMSKVLACMSIMNQKFKGSEPDPSIYSTMMLKCYISLSDSQAKKIIVGLETGTNSLSKKEIDKLTDYDSLKDLPQNELKKKSYELEKTLKNLKKLQDEFSGERGEDIDPADYDDEYDDDDNFNRETPSNINFLGLIPKGIYAVFNIFNSYLSLFVVFVIVYFGLLMIRKINDSEKKMKKKKRIMKRRIEEEYEEEEEEEYEQEIKDKKGQKKFKKN